MTGGGTRGTGSADAAVGDSLRGGCKVTSSAAASGNGGPLPWLRSEKAQAGTARRASAPQALGPRTLISGDELLFLASDEALVTPDELVGANGATDRDAPY